MLILNHTYRIYPDDTQQSLLQEWLETCRQVYNYSLRELKDWLASRKSMSDRCSLEKEYIIPADAPFPSYQRQQDALPKAKKEFPRLKEIHSQVSCKLLFVDCTILGNRFRSEILGFLDSKSLGSSSRLCSLSSKVIPLLTDTSN